MDRHSLELFVNDGEHVTYIRYKPEINVIRVDRSRCGIRYDMDVEKYELALIGSREL